jgi:hypothetical protein
MLNLFFVFPHFAPNPISCVFVCKLIPDFVCVIDDRRESVGFIDETFCGAKYVFPLLPAFQGFGRRRWALRDCTQVCDDMRIICNACRVCALQMGTHLGTQKHVLARKCQQRYSS